MPKSKQRKIRIFKNVRFVCCSKGIWTTAEIDGYTLIHRDRNRWELWRRASGAQDGLTARLVRHGETMRDAAQGLR